FSAHSLRSCTTITTAVSTLSLHDALPICVSHCVAGHPLGGGIGDVDVVVRAAFLQGGVVHLRRGHPDDGELVGPQLDGLTDGVAAVAHPVDVVAHHADPLVFGAVHELDAAALRNGGAGHAVVSLADADGAGLTETLGPHLDRRTGAVHAHHGGDAREKIGPAFNDAVHLVDIYVAGPRPEHVDLQKVHPHGRNAG